MSDILVALQSTKISLNSPDRRGLRCDTEAIFTVGNREVRKGIIEQT